MLFSFQRLSAEQDKRLNEQLSDVKDRNEKFVVDQQVVAQHVIDKQLKFIGISYCGHCSANNDKLMLSCDCV